MSKVRQMPRNVDQRPGTASAMPVVLQDWEHAYFGTLKTKAQWDMQDRRVVGIQK